MINLLYFLAVLCPPLAVLLCRRYLAALLCCLCLIAFWVPGVVFAWLIVRDYKQERFLKKLRA